jgi:hypothetical protein
MASTIYEYSKSMNFSTGNKDEKARLESNHPIPTIAKGNIYQGIPAIW